jgi:Glyoxalase-like domain
MDDHVRLRRPGCAGGVLVPGPGLRGRRAARGFRDPGGVAGQRRCAAGGMGPEPKTAKNRVHLDVQAGGGRGGPQEVRWARVLAAVRRLTEAGAAVIREDLQGRVPDHFVMADPEGNEFCVV